MIKLAILTPKNSYEKIKKSLENFEEKIDYIFYNNLYELEELYIKNAQNYDGIITSGPIGYEIIKDNIELITPLYYFDISKGDLFEYLFLIQKNNPNIDFSRVYIDFISPEKSKYWFENIFSDEEKPIFLELNFSNKSLYETLQNNYIKLKNEEKIDIILTRISNMVSFLEKEEIPFRFLFPSEDNIRKTISEVVKDIKILKSEKNQIVFGKVYFKEKKENIEDLIHSISKNCIVKNKKDETEIIMMLEDFNNSNIAMELQKKIKTNFFAGWGRGDNINEARYNATKSYNKSFDLNSNVQYLCTNNSLIMINDLAPSEKKNIEIVEKLETLNIDRESVEIIINLSRNNNEVTCKDLASYLNLSERTASRILVKLEENNLVTSIVFKLNRGRPKKIYKFIF